MIAGFWRRWLSGFFDAALASVTFGVMGIISIVWRCEGKQTFGDKAAGIKLEGDNLVSYMMFLIFLQLLFYAVTFAIGFWIDIVRICMKKGTLFEKWNNTFFNVVG